jgi:aminomuconate-semialdehyde/2-hydroxymuconate-6-semialdehyde dehydrogenase
MEKLANYIDGKLVPPTSGEYIDNYNPSKGEVFSLIPKSDSSDVDAAYAAAAEAFPGWSNSSNDERSRILFRISALLEEHLEEFAEAESLDNGKPLWLARQVDIPRAISNFRFFSQAATQFASESHAMQDKAINYTLRDPIGVVGCISPWNLPLYLFTWKIAPALATGNCVVAKPSEVTPYTAYKLSEICQKAGLPAGVLNIVHGLGPEVGAAIVVHPKIKAVSFTGGTQTGEWIARTAAPMFKKLSLELGGKNPTIVFGDCDMKKTLKEVFRTAFANQGQICLCGSRLFVQKSIYTEFKNAFIEIVKNQKVGPPRDSDSKLGAVVSKGHMVKVLSYIDLAKEEGGTILCGGEQLHMSAPYDKGYYIAPTVVEGLSHTCRTNQEEIFGPVITITPFETEEEVLEMANSTEYGLAASVWTENLSRAHRMAKKLESGIVWINCWLLRDLRTPFGGVKSSGVGREGGFEAMKFFTEPKNVCIQYGD